MSLRGEMAKEIAGISEKITDQTQIMVTMIAGFSLAVCAAMASGILDIVGALTEWDAHRQRSR
ncbi:MAG: hypothetical protein OXB92_13270 [Acidimicrobiaceae bacterium]|nr:hypothetical protein [Acidimicrobiia bacterium]MCY4494819.1 hypothetical protein [Acidimicrobiaceae bacterium]